MALLPRRRLFPSASQTRKGAGGARGPRDRSIDRSIDPQSVGNATTNADRLVCAAGTL
jgi:hypothetical protein